LGLEKLQGIGHFGVQGVDRGVILKRILREVVCNNEAKIYLA